MTQTQFLVRTMLPLLGSALALASRAPPAYKTYHNTRFGYRLDYPADCKPQPESGNGDGRRFIAADRQTVLTAYASYQNPEGSLAEDHKLARQTWQEQHATLPLD